ncbi:MAG: helix-hairpin-helix domain-containing protein [Chlamydiae bacterium]|nr:helix-hairpin-helix domain-containing protein [Chlamydiota bacterium]MBI3267037.1 helix-hairpin-helix domain-containing protein [Chlamydiota bacterium]
MNRINTQNELTPPTPLNLRGENLSPYLRGVGGVTSFQTGAALILALGILALITVLAISFATLMRFEEKSARQSLYLIEARQMAAAGLQYAIAILEKDLTEDEGGTTSTSLGGPSLYDSLDEEWATLFTGSDTDLDGDGNNDSKWIYIHEDADGTGPVIGRYAVLIQDEAGKVNLNVAGNGSQNEGWSPYELDMSALPDIGSTKADAILDYRRGTDIVNGADASELPLEGDDNDNNISLSADGIDNNATAGADEINEGANDPTEFDPEIPYEDDRPFASLEELSKVNGIGSDTINNIRDEATVNSLDTNQYWNGSSWLRKINLNHLLSTSQLYSLTLTTTNEKYRLSANMIDYADRDIYPTFTTTTVSAPDASNSYMGVEGLQINEIMNNPSSTSIARTEAQSTLSGQGAWNQQSGYDEGNSTDDIGQWSWPWDNGPYWISVDETNGSNITIDGQAISDPSSFTRVIISGEAIDLSITDAQESTPPQQLATFTQINIMSGKYIEIINISQRAITIDCTGSDAWKLALGGTVNFPTLNRDGLPGTVSGATYSLSLDATGSTASDITLSGLQSSTSPPTYDYLIIADSAHALDELYGGDGDGAWSGSGSEPGHVITNGDLANELASSGVDLALVNSNDEVIAYVPASATNYHIAAYGGPSTAGQSMSRVSAVDETGSWNSWTYSPGTDNDNANNDITSSGARYWSIKDRPYSTIGELSDVFLGTSHNGTYNIESSSASSFFDKITIAAKRLEAEDADSILWSSWESASDNDGTTRYIAGSNTASATWTWTFDITDSSDITNPFRLRENTGFDVLVYSQFARDFQSPSGEDRFVRPNHSVAVDSETVTSNRISIPIIGNGSDTPKLDYIVLTPEPYTYGRININTASQDALMSLPGIASSLSSNIISYRETDPFNQIQEITSASSVGESTFEPISNLITVRSDVYRIIIRSERIMDIDGDGIENDPSDSSVSTASLDTIVDRNPTLRFPGTSNRYRIEFQKYRYE